MSPTSHKRASPATASEGTAEAGAVQVGAVHRAELASSLAAAAAPGALLAEVVFGVGRLHEQIERQGFATIA